MTISARILFGDLAITSPSYEGDLMLLSYDTMDKRQQWTWEDNFLTNQETGLVLQVKAKKGEELKENTVVVAKIRAPAKINCQSWIQEDMDTITLQFDKRFTLGEQGGKIVIKEKSSSLPTVKYVNNSSAPAKIYVLHSIIEMGQSINVPTGTEVIALNRVGSLLIEENTPNNNSNNTINTSNDDGEQQQSVKLTDPIAGMISAKFVNMTSDVVKIAPSLGEGFEIVGFASKNVISPLGTIYTVTDVLSNCLYFKDSAGVQHYSVDLIFPNQVFCVVGPTYKECKITFVNHAGELVVVESTAGYSFSINDKKCLCITSPPSTKFNFKYKAKELAFKDFANECHPTLMLTTPEQFYHIINVGPSSKRVSTLGPFSGGIRFRGIAVNPNDGTLYATAPDENCIYRINLDGTYEVFAGSGIAGHQDGDPVIAKFNGPYGIAVDYRDGCVYVSEETGHTVRKITPQGLVSTLAGSPGVSGFADGTKMQAKFSRPFGIGVDKGWVYVPDFDNHAIRKISPLGVVSTIAGCGTKGLVNGSGTQAKFNSPEGVKVDPRDGSLFVLDTFNHCIRKVTAEGRVSTLAGSGSWGYLDGHGTQASFNTPRQIELNLQDYSLLLSDDANHVIRKISATGDVSTLAGVGWSGNQDGRGNEAQFTHPWGITLHQESGIIYVSDKNGIRKIE